MSTESAADRSPSTPDEPPKESSRTKAEARDDVRRWVVPLAVAVIVGLGASWLTNVGAADESLVTARRAAWASYLGTLDELSRIQPGLTDSAAPGPSLTDRWNAAYPDSKRQAAGVRILYGDKVSKAIKNLQDKRLSVIDEWVQTGKWLDGKPPSKDLKVSDEMEDLVDVAQDSVGG